jgi:hypothetical protein
LRRRLLWRSSSGRKFGSVLDPNPGIYGIRLTSRTWRFYMCRICRPEYIFIERVYRKEACTRRLSTGWTSSL